MYRVLFLILGLLLFQACGTGEDFDEKAIEAYDMIEYYFINSVPNDEWDIGMMSWINENLKEMENNPEKYGEKESIVFENLSSMMVTVGIMNNLDYRDRILEEKYYGSRDMIKPYLDIDD